MKITFDPHDSQDVAHVLNIIAPTQDEAPARPSNVLASPPAPQAAPPAAVPCAPVAPPPAAPAAAPPAAPPVAPPPSSEHEAGRQRLTEIVQKLGPAGNQVGALLAQVGAQSVSGLTLEQLRWVLAEAEKMVPPA